MTTTFEPGNRVYVTDPGLAAMRAIMRQATGREPIPNHCGTIAEIDEDGWILINFDSEEGEGQGQCAPYPPEEVQLLP